MAKRSSRKAKTSVPEAAAKAEEASSDEKEMTSEVEEVLKEEEKPTEEPKELEEELEEEPPPPEEPKEPEMRLKEAPEKELKALERKYLVVATTRGYYTRSKRRTAPKHHKKVQKLLGGALIARPNRPVPISEPTFRENLDYFRKLEEEGKIEIQTMHREKVDLVTLKPISGAPSPPDKAPRGPQKMPPDPIPLTPAEENLEISEVNKGVLHTPSAVTHPNQQDPAKKRKS